MPSRLTPRRTLGIAGLLLGLAALSPGLDLLNAHYTRAELRRQLTHWRQAAALERLRYELHSDGPRDSRLHLELAGSASHQAGPVLDLTLAHRGLDSLVTGQAGYRTEQGALIPAARLRGRIRFRPGRDLQWTLALDGAAAEFPANPRGWRLDPWQATVDGNPRRIAARADLPRLAIAGHGPGSGALERLHARLQLTLGPGDDRSDTAATDSSAATPRLRASLAVDGGRIQAPTAMVTFGALHADLALLDGADGWPWRLQADAADLVHLGMPFGRAAEARVTASGLLTGTGGGLAWWDGQAQLHADTSYGPLAARADLLGTGAASGLSLGRLELTADLPAGLWSLLQRFFPALARDLRAAGAATDGGPATRLRALYRNGVWYRPAP